MTPSILYLALALFSAPAEEPRLVPTTEAVTLPATPVAISEVELPIEIPRAAIESALDGIFAGGDHGGTLHSASDLAIPHGRAEVTITRAGGLTVTLGDDGALKLRLPLKIKARLDFKTKLFKHHEDIEGALTVEGVVRPDVGADWQVAAQSSFGFTWDSAPSIKVLGIEISLRSLAGKLVQEQLERLPARVDNLARERVPLRSLVERGWKEATGPIEVAPKLWLVATPKSLRYFGVRRNGDTLVLGVGAGAHLALRSGDRPSPGTAGHLPPPTRASGEPKGVQLHVQHDLSLTDVIDAAQQSLAGKEWVVPVEDRKVSLAFTSLELRANADALAFTAVAAVDPRALGLPLAVSGTLRASRHTQNELGLALDGLRVEMGPGLPLPAKLEPQVMLQTAFAVLRQKIESEVATLGTKHGIRLELAVKTLNIGGMKAHDNRVSFDLHVIAGARVSPALP